MHSRITRTMCAVAAAALISLGLASAAGPAEAAGVPAGFKPMSASFLSPSSGFVLGGVGCTYGNPVCRARLAATTDGGARWHFAGAPEVLLFYGAGDLLTQASRVSGVVFANTRDGWLYGPGLYATHDGGAHWQRISLGGTSSPRWAAASRRWPPPPGPRGPSSILTRSGAWPMSCTAARSARTRGPGSAP